MDGRAAAKRLIVPQSRVTFLGNQLVVVAAKDNPVASRCVHPPRWRGIGCGAARHGGCTGPGGPIMARRRLKSLGVWSAVAPKVVRGDSVRAALTLVERGAAPLGIVYATDAKASAKVRIAGVFPASSHPPVTYPIARLARSTNPEGERFRRFLISAPGKAIFPPLRVPAPLMLSAEEWGIVGLSLRVGGWRWRRLLPVAFALAWALGARAVPANCCSTRSSTCRWWCRRW